MAASARAGDLSESRERVASGPTVTFWEGKPYGLRLLTPARGPPTILPPPASASARRLTPLSGEANGPFQAGGHVALIKQEGRRRGGSRCRWLRAGSGREQGAAAKEARGRRAGAEAAVSVGGEHPGAVGAGEAAAMAVAVGRPSVSAGASFPYPATPPALGGPALGRVPAGIRGPREGARGGGGGGCGCVHEFGRASGAEGRASSPEAWLLRDATVHRLVRPDSRDVGEEGPLSCFPFRKILLAKVFLGCSTVCAHTFSLVTVETGAG